MRESIDTEPYLNAAAKRRRTPGTYLTYMLRGEARRWADRYERVLLRTLRRRERDGKVVAVPSARGGTAYMRASAGALLMSAGALVVLVVATVASASPVPRFENPNLVALKMEAYYNSTDYKRRLNASNPGTRLTTRVLCAYEDYGSLGGEVQCTARMRVQRETDSKWVVANVQWTLEKKTRTRAKLTFTVTGPGVFESSFEIVSPKAFDLRRF